MIIVSMTFDISFIRDLIYDMNLTANILILKISN